MSDYTYAVTYDPPDDYDPPDIWGPFEDEAKASTWVRQHASANDLSRDHYDVLTMTTPTEASA